MVYPTPTILIVEDDPSTIQLTRMMMDYAGVKAQLDFAQTAEQFRSKLHSYLTKEVSAPLLVLMDLSLPTEDGFALIEAWKSHPELALVPIAVLSGSDLEIDRQRAQALDVAAYLVKPLRLAQIEALCAAYVK